MAAVSEGDILEFCIGFDAVAIEPTQTFFGKEDLISLRTIAVTYG